MRGLNSAGAIPKANWRPRSSRKNYASFAGALPSPCQIEKIISFISSGCKIHLLLGSSWPFLGRIPIPAQGGSNIGALATEPGDLGGVKVSIGSLADPGVARGL
jgi:hypothetical protein